MGEKWGTEEMLHNCILKTLIFYKYILVREIYFGKRNLFLQNNNYTHDLRKLVNYEIDKRLVKFCV